VRGWSVVDAVLIFALLGFLTLSGYAAFEGLFDIILAEQPALATDRQWYYILGAVALITAAMWALLEVALRRGQFRRRLPAALMYGVLALWSIGFGYGFWWKVIASRSETRSGIETAAAAVQQQVEKAENSVGFVEGLLGSVGATADAKQKREEAGGGSCGSPSKRGTGPLSKRRTEITNQVLSLKGKVDTLWLAPLRTALNGKPDSAGRLVGGLKTAQAKLDPRLMRELSEDGRRKVYDEVRTASNAAINAIQTLNSVQGKFFAEEFRVLAKSLDVAATSTACSDPELAQELRRAATLAESKPDLAVPDFEVNEGAAATAKAFNKIWANIFWLARQLPASVGLMSAGPSPEPLAGRDVIALIASIVVDLCICVFAYIRTRAPLDASHMFQPAHAGARAKLESAVRAFAADDSLDARKVFNACILRNGRSYYFIVPHLSSPMSSLWRPGAIFLQNILIVLEAVHAIKGNYEATGARAFWRSLVPGLGSRRLFEKAARQLRESGWGIEPVTADGAPLPPLVTASGLSLHRFRHGDLLELLLVLRQDQPAARVSTAEVAPAIKAPVVTETWPVTTLRRMRSGLQQILNGIRERAGDRQSMLLRRDAVPPVSAAAGVADDGSPLAATLPEIHDRDDQPDLAPDAIVDPGSLNADENPRSDLFLFSEFRDRQPVDDHSAGAALPVTPTVEAVPHARGVDDILSPKRDPAVQLEEPEAAPNVEGAGPRDHDAGSSKRRLDEVFQSIDDLNRAIRFAEQDSARSGEAQGLAITSRRLIRHLEEAGLVGTAQIGQHADPDLHHVLAMEPSPEPPGTILRIDAQGYRETGSGRLVREAQVVVSDGSAGPEGQRLNPPLTTSEQGPPYHVDTTGTEAST
jgi:hypothetical protein